MQWLFWISHNKKGSGTSFWCTFCAWFFHKKGSLQRTLKPPYIYHISSLFCIHFRANKNFNAKFTSGTFFYFLSYHCKTSGKTKGRILRKTSCKSIYVRAYADQKFQRQRLAMPTKLPKHVLKETAFWCHCALCVFISMPTRRKYYFQSSIL